MLQPDNSFIESVTGNQILWSSGHLNTLITEHGIPILVIHLVCDSPGDGRESFNVCALQLRLASLRKHFVEKFLMYEICTRMKARQLPYLKIPNLSDSIRSDSACTACALHASRQGHCLFFAALICPEDPLAGSDPRRALLMSGF